jgi:hypothetical protein
VVVQGSKGDNADRLGLQLTRTFMLDIVLVLLRPAKRWLATECHAVASVSLYRAHTALWVGWGGDWCGRTGEKFSFQFLGAGYENCVYRLQLRLLGGREIYRKKNEEILLLCCHVRSHTHTHPSLSALFTCFSTSPPTVTSILRISYCIN